MDMWTFLNLTLCDCDNNQICVYSHTLYVHVPSLHILTFYLFLALYLLSPLSLSLSLTLSIASRADNILHITQTH